MQISVKIRRESTKVIKDLPPVNAVKAILNG